MPIKQRCSKCRQFVTYGTRICPNPSCGGAVHKSVYLVKKVRGRLVTRSLGICTRSDAETEHARFILEIGRGIISAPTFLGELLDGHVAKMCAEKKDYHQRARLFFDRALTFFGDVDISRITPDQARKFQTWLIAGRNSESYCDKHIAMCKAAWNSGAWGRPNPFEQVKLFNPDNTLIRWLSDDEEARLLIAAKELPNKPGHNQGGMTPLNLHEIILIAIHTGLRKQNILKLHVDEIHAASRMIIVRQKRNRTHVAYINEAVQGALQSVTPNDQGWYFPNPLTNKPYTDIVGTFEAVKKLAGITKPFRFHDLRHHAATKLLRLTGNLRLVQLFLGHSTAAVTEKYAHVLADDQRAAVEQLCGRGVYKKAYQLGIDDAINLLSHGDTVPN